MLAPLLHLLPSMQAREKHDITDLTSRTPGLTKQLQSLTVVCCRLAASSAGPKKRELTGWAVVVPCFNTAAARPHYAVALLLGILLLVQAREKHDLADLTSRAPALSKQLQGLTVVCSGPSEQHDEWASPYRPVPLLTALTALTSEFNW